MAPSSKYLECKECILCVANALTSRNDGCPKESFSEVVDRGKGFFRTPKCNSAIGNSK